MEGKVIEIFHIVKVLVGGLLQILVGDLNDFKDFVSRIVQFAKSNKKKATIKKCSTNNYNKLNKCIYFEFMHL